MFRAGLLSLFLFVPIASVQAQDAGQIAAVQNGKSCQGCNLFQADFSDMNLPGLDLSGSRLRQANLALAQMNKVNFSKADLSIAYMFGGRFTGASFAGADLRKASLVGSYLHSADMTGALIEGAVFSGAEMETAKGLTQSQLDTACGDEFTLLPPGLSIPKCMPNDAL